MIEIFRKYFFLVSYILILFFSSCGPFVLFTLLTVFDILSTYFETQNWPEALKKGVSSRKRNMFFRTQWNDGEPKEAAAEVKLLELS